MNKFNCLSEKALKYEYGMQRLKVQVWASTSGIMLADRTKMDNFNVNVDTQNIWSSEGN